MSPLAWRILKVLLDAWLDHTEFLLDWHIAEMLNSSQQVFYPNTNEGKAIQELFDKGLIEEVPVLHGYHGYRLTVKEK